MAKFKFPKLNLVNKLRSFLMILGVILLILIVFNLFAPSLAKVNEGFVEENEEMEGFVEGAAGSTKKLASSDLKEIKGAIDEDMKTTETEFNAMVAAGRANSAKISDYLTKVHKKKELADKALADADGMAKIGDLVKAKLVTMPTKKSDSKPPEPKKSDSKPLEPKKSDSKPPEPKKSDSKPPEPKKSDSKPKK